MNFVRYDINTGVITAYGFMEEKFVQAEIDAGKPTLITDGVYPSEFWKVDLATKQLVQIAPFPTLPPGFEPIVIQGE